MALSFVLKTAEPTSGPSGRSVLITGAAGNIGQELARYLANRYALKLMVRPPDDESAEALAPYGEVVRAEMSDPLTLQNLFRGVDTIVHLAGEPDPSAEWAALLDANIIGCYHVMSSAKTAGCRRVIFASSIHAVSGYPKDVQVNTSQPPNPGDLYGVTKCFGESLGRYFAEKEGLSVIALRIGAFQATEKIRQDASLAMMDCFLSHRDLGQLIGRCVDNDTLQFAIFHAVSDNRFKRLDISDARELVGFSPEDDFTEENPVVAHLDLQENVVANNVSDPAQKSGVRP